MTKIVWHIRQFGPTQALQMRLQGWSEAVTHSFLLVCPFGRRGAPPSCSCRRVMTCFRALADIRPTTCAWNGGKEPLTMHSWML